ncbi:hypothetical protein TeGR_g13985, partial [Tetraparma gracilis]
FTLFLEELFRRWKALDVTHSISVVFFARSYLAGSEAAPSPDDDPSPLGAGKSTRHKDVDGRVYEDHYLPVVENVTASDWSGLVHQVKVAFCSFPERVGWHVSPRGVRVPSVAKQGNVLEAINTTLNVLQYHYMDRDLTRTGNSIVVVSPGDGVFEVDRSLAAVTRQRMMDCGVGSDCICLALPPLHVTPFFVYKKSEADAAADAAGGGGEGDWKKHF